MNKPLLLSPHDRGHLPNERNISLLAFLPLHCLTPLADME